MTKGAQDRGFTLIELIVFIIVAGIFIPMAYIAFMAAARGSLSPEAVVNARFLAERKLEDITKDTYLNLQAEQASYIAVPGYTGYQWRWTIQSIAYQGHTTHESPTLGAPETWQATTVYRVGDYVQPSTTDCQSPLYYRCVPRNRWQSLTVYTAGAYISPTLPNNYSYRCTDRPILASTFPQWQPNHLYSVGAFVLPSIGNGHAYVCVTAGTSGSTEPSPWPTSPHAFLNEGSVLWREATLTTYAVEPSWGSANQLDDGTITWMREMMQSGAIVPSSSWPCTSSGELDDGTLRWKESTSYKRITVYVREPKGYEYIVNSIVTARPGAYP